MNLQTGEENGIMPIFAKIRAMAIVANGAYHVGKGE
jgi:hypothetical protein